MMDLTKIGKPFWELDDTTHPAGTADLVKHLRGGLVMVSVGLRAADRIEELETALAAVGNASAHRITDLETALTRANAATAAAYEVAAQVCENGDEFDPSTAIRALATPDQTAALDKLIAEVEARVWADAAEIVRNLGKYELATSKAPMGQRTQAFYAAYDALLAASKKGGV